MEPLKINRTLICASIVACLSNPVIAGDDQSVWQKLSTQQSYSTSTGEVIELASDIYRLDIASLKVHLNNKDSSDFKIKVPSLKGHNIEFILVENSTFPNELKKKFPNIRSYTARNTENKQLTGRFELSSKGLSGMYRNSDGDWIFIDPIANSVDKHRIYNGSAARLKSKQRPADSVLELLENKSTNNSKTVAPDFGDELRSYRIAVSAAGEFTQYHGGSVAEGLAAINTTINRVNEVYNRDLAVQLNIVANNDQLVFTDGGTDPFANDTGDIYTNQTVIDNAIGNGSYDIGHIVNTAGGGLAGLGVVCSNTAKARGVTGLSNPINDVFYIDYVAHEIGHQFRANHTFNGGTGSCGGNRAATAAFEPGSGSTIMGYAGICGEQNIQGFSDAFFHTHSVDEVRSFVTSGGGSNCGVLSSLSNTPPSADAGENIVIPANTPFQLVGSATDADNGDQANLTYSWEQRDLGSQTPNRAAMIDDGSRPLFRAILPDSEPQRYFPQLSNVVSGTSSYTEVLPTTDRVMNFRLTVRDDRGGVSSDDITVTSDTSAGPFEVTTPATADPVAGGLPTTINWNVANTNAGAVACNQVDIKFSDDAGASFSQTLLPQTNNDGSAEVILPNQNIAAARVMVMCSNQSFFNVSPVNFSVTRTEGIPSITSQDPLSTNEDIGLTINVADLNIEDSNNTSPSDFTLTLLDGNNYTVSGTTVTPAENFFGNLTVNAYVNDGTYDSPVYPLQVSVISVNDPPRVLFVQEGLGLNEDSTFTLYPIYLVIEDPDHSEFTVQIEDGTNYSANEDMVIPTPNYNGPLTVSFRVSDGESTSSLATIELNVNPQNDAPTASNDNFSVTTNATNITLDVMANDQDIDVGDDLNITSVSYSGTGTLVISNDGKSLIYTPASDFEGTESFNYSITDPGNETASASATITVSAPSSGGGGSISLWISLLLAGAFLRKRI
ncbi:reprolysin-like metallopeptidase [Pleionea litopenaei]|uniref:Tandem-95 repeat protein n=1 Tax=Pleionea litopenaei TaxID=3070815 RepID=A0AA51RUN0_9GAMM|nr:tandem-95 repeat protein [Pleionea sp. HL-JVS1]WMS87912.1 tandem-95 repeat protein [Pleionea sp. HL-JVS1]